MEVFKIDEDKFGTKNLEHWRSDGITLKMTKIEINLRNKREPIGVKIPTCDVTILKNVEFMIEQFVEVCKILLTWIVIKTFND